MTEKLYILVRTDMDSMTPGRIAAQAAHAANMFVGYAEVLKQDLKDNEEPDDPFIVYFDNWQKQTSDFFGTTIVLNGGTEQDIEQILIELEDRYITGRVIDPEYPIRDGDTVHILKNVMTCGYAFHFGEGKDDGLKDWELL